MCARAGTMYRGTRLKKKNHLHTGGELRMRLGSYKQPQRLGTSKHYFGRLQPQQSPSFKTNSTPAGSSKGTESPHTNRTGSMSTGSVAILHNFLSCFIFTAIKA